MPRLAPSASHASINLISKHKPHETGNILIPVSQLSKLRVATGVFSLPPGPGLLSKSKRGRGAECVLLNKTKMALAQIF